VGLPKQFPLPAQQEGEGIGSVRERRRGDRQAQGERACRQSVGAGALAGERARGQQGPLPRAHRAVLADALAALDGFLVVTQGRRVAVVRAAPCSSGCLHRF
jgi:hypothetical protein